MAWVFFYLHPTLAAFNVYPNDMVDSQQIKMMRNHSSLPCVYFCLSEWCIVFLTHWAYYVCSCVVCVGELFHCSCLLYSMLSVVCLSVVCVSLSLSLPGGRWLQARASLGTYVVSVDSQYVLIVVVARVLFFSVFLSFFLSISLCV